MAKPAFVHAGRGEAKASPSVWGPGSIGGYFLGPREEGCVGCGRVEEGGGAAGGEGEEAKGKDEEREGNRMHMRVTKTKVNMRSALLLWDKFSWLSLVYWALRSKAPPQNMLLGFTTFAPSSNEMPPLHVRNASLKSTKTCCCCCSGLGNVQKRTWSLSMSQKRGLRGRLTCEGGRVGGREQREGGRGLLARPDRKMGSGEWVGKRQARLVASYLDNAITTRNGIPAGLGFFQGRAASVRRGMRTNVLQGGKRREQG